MNTQINRHCWQLCCLLLLSAIAPARAKELKSIEEYQLDEHTVYTLPVSCSRVTTISFPGPISAIDGANVTADGKSAGLFQIAHTKGSYFFSIKALAPKAETNINVRWNKKTYVIELVEGGRGPGGQRPLYSVIFQLPTEEKGWVVACQVTPNRLLALLDKAKSYPLLRQYHPESVAQVEFVSYAKQPRIVDYNEYEVRLEEAFRFNPEDTIVFRAILHNKSGEPINYRPDGFAIRVGERTYTQSISDASGVIPPRSDSPVYFAITGTANGGHNDLSLKNEFTVILDRLRPSPPPPQSPAAEQPEPEE